MLTQPWLFKQQPGATEVVTYGCNINNEKRLKHIYLVNRFFWNNHVQRTMSLRHSLTVFNLFLEDEIV